MPKPADKQSAIRLDLKNANKGTERGRVMLIESLKQYGAGRSVLIDKNGRLIAGNKTYEAALAGGAVAAIQVVESDGQDIIAVKRLDLDLNDAAARGLAYADNRVSEVNLNWDVDKLVRDIENGIGVGQFWFDDELSKLINGTPGELESGATGDAEDETPQFNQDGTAVKMVQLFLNDSNFPAFTHHINLLMQAHDKANVTDAVLEALRLQAASVPLELEPSGARRIDLG